jgi:hypothetical protein
MISSIFGLFLLVLGAQQSDSKQLIDNNRVTVWEAATPDPL